MSIFERIVQDTNLPTAKKAFSTAAASKADAPSRMDSLMQMSPIPHNLGDVIDERFKITIRQEANSRTNGPERIVEAALPESIGLNTTSDWNTPFAEGLLGPGKLQTLGQVSGWLPTVQALTAHFWAGSQPIGLSLPITLIAHRSTDEILRKVLMLKAMTMPTKEPTTGFLRAPGPLMELEPEHLWPYAKKVYQAGANLASAAYQGMLDAVPLVDNTSNLDSSIDGLRDTLRETTQAAEKLFKVTGRISIRLGKFLYFSDVVMQSLDEQQDIILAENGRYLKANLTLNFITRTTPTLENMDEMHLVAPGTAIKGGRA